MKQKQTLTPEARLAAAQLPREAWPYALPAGWQWVRLGDITEVVGGGTPSSKHPEYYDGGTIPWIRPADLSGYHEKYISHGEKNITQLGLEKSSARLLPADTVLLSSRAPIGYVAIAANEVCTNQGFKSFLPSELYDPSYLYWYLLGNKAMLERNASGTTFLELSGKKAAQLLMPLPPFSEQRRLVQRIEGLFARLDAAAAKITAASDAAARRKAAILHAAFTGQLTEQWRESAGRGSFHKSSMLLKDVCEKITDGTHHSPPNTQTGDYMYITAKNIKEDGLDLQDITYVSQAVHEEIYARCDVHKGDVLYIKDGATAGIATVNDLDEPFSMLSSVAVLRTCQDKLLPEYLKYLLNSPDIRSEMLNRVSGNAITRLTLKKIKETIVPICEVAEQREIVRRLDGLLAREARASATIERARTELQRLRTAILARAFRGEL